MSPAFGERPSLGLLDGGLDCASWGGGYGQMRTGWRDPADSDEGEVDEYGDNYGIRGSRRSVDGGRELPTSTKRHRPALGDGDEDSDCVPYVDARDEFDDDDAVRGHCGVGHRGGNGHGGKVTAAYGLESDDRGEDNEEEEDNVPLARSRGRATNSLGVRPTQEEEGFSWGRKTIASGSGKGKGRVVSGAGFGEGGIETGGGWMPAPGGGKTWTGPSGGKARVGQRTRRLCKMSMGEQKRVFESLINREIANAVERTRRVLLDDVHGRDSPLAWTDLVRIKNPDVKVTKMSGFVKGYLRKKGVDLERRVLNRFGPEGRATRRLTYVVPRRLAGDFLRAFEEKFPGSLDL
ncbi:hypothetical protein HK101_005188 [Irineochytrium annulatum]|nr:hypothetical protein HK101_005188 [Irineochytrium annulatum]